MIFNHFKVLKSCSLSTQSLASCVNYFVWNCLPCFSNTKIGSVTSFSILFNFQGPVSASADRLTAYLFYHLCDNLSSCFLKFLISFWRTHRTSFFFEAFLSDARLTWMYFSTASGKKQDLFSVFFLKSPPFTFCPVFRVFFWLFHYGSSKRRIRISFKIFLSRREICTCVVCKSFAVSLWVRLA